MNVPCKNKHEFSQLCVVPHVATTLRAELPDSVYGDTISSIRQYQKDWLKKIIAQVTGPSKRVTIEQIGGVLDRKCDKQSVLEKRSKAQSKMQTEGCSPSAKQNAKQNAEQSMRKVQSMSKVQSKTRSQKRWRTGFAAKNLAANNSINL